MNEVSPSVGFINIAAVEKSEASKLNILYIVCCVYACIMCTVQQCLGLTDSLDNHTLTPKL